MSGCLPSGNAGAHIPPNCPEAHDGIGAPRQRSGPARVCQHRLGHPPAPPVPLTWSQTSAREMRSPDAGQQVREGRAHGDGASEASRRVPFPGPVPAAAGSHAAPSNPAAAPRPAPAAGRTSPSRRVRASESDGRFALGSTARNAARSATRSGPKILPSRRGSPKSTGPTHAHVPARDTRACMTR